ncbi:urease accessory protein UreE [Bifidobacterium leontopitheci]|uniref:Urease accessory protein UreE n=1 Tax=Bifidobacterium leontopitheci TaxID=2650774 RepID=A0A6I1GJX2_9BIFI|nr:urease accessory protein UreE [Bifidobacterium leontopitheci]KAB7789936.1 urease accessory protein UreE [Bifidobacterium leontopitheci]
MIAKEITGNIIDNPPNDGKLSVPIEFDWFETDKKRMRKVAEDGTEFGVMVGRTIKDGDVLAETDDKRYFARIRTAQLIEIPVSTMKEMGRLCFELGNRHLSLKVENDRVLVPYDHPTMEYTKKIGFEPRIIEGGFDGFLIVKAHAGSGTIVPGTGKTTGDLAEEEQEAEADAAFAGEQAAGHLDVHAHAADETDAADGHDDRHAHDHGDHAHGHHHHIVEEPNVDADHPYQLKPGEYETNGVLHRPDGSHSHDGGRTWHTH